MFMEVSIHPVVSLFYVRVASIKMIFSPGGYLLKRKTMYAQERLE